MADAWTLSGTIVIACNCDYGCPCNFNARPTQGKCEGGWVWKVQAGRWGDLDLTGAAFSLFADWPGAIHEAGGRAIAFADEALDDRRREAVRRLLHGEAGGPWGILINTYELEGPRFVPHELELQERGAVVRVGDAVELATEPVRNPVTNAESHWTLQLHSGLVASRAAMLASRIFRVRDGVSYDHSGQYAALGEFSYTGP